MFESRRHGSTSDAGGDVAASICARMSHPVDIHRIGQISCAVNFAQEPSVFCVRRTSPWARTAHPNLRILLVTPRYVTWKNFYRHAKLLATETVISYFVIVLPRYFYRQVAIPLTVNFSEPQPADFLPSDLPSNVGGCEGIDSTKGMQKITLIFSDLIWNTRAVYYVWKIVDRIQ